MANKKYFFAKVLFLSTCITTMSMLSACNHSENNVSISNDSICEIMGEVTSYEMLQNYYGCKLDSFEFDPLFLCDCIEEVLDRPNAIHCMAGASIEFMNNDWRKQLYEKHGIFFYQNDVDSLLLHYLYDDTLHQIKSVETFDSLICCFQKGNKDVRADSMELLNIYTAFQAWNIRFWGISDTSMKKYVVDGMEYFSDKVCLPGNEGMHYYVALAAIDELITRSYAIRPQNISKMVEGFIRVAKNNGEVKHIREKDRILEQYFDTLTIEPYPRPITLLP